MTLQNCKEMGSAIFGLGAGFFYGQLSFKDPRLPGTDHKTRS